MIELKTDVVKDITRWRAMPPELADHVIRFYSHYSRKHAAAVMDDERALLDALAVAPSLRREVLTHLLGKSVALIPLFSRDRVSYAHRRQPKLPATSWPHAAARCLLVHALGSLPCV